MNFFWHHMFIYYIYAVNCLTNVCQTHKPHSLTSHLVAFKKIINNYASEFKHIDFIYVCKGILNQVDKVMEWKHWKHWIISAFKRFYEVMFVNLTDTIKGISIRINLTNDVVAWCFESTRNPHQLNVRFEHETAFFLWK